MLHDPEKRSLISTARHARLGRPGGGWNDVLRGTSSTTPVLANTGRKAGLGGLLARDTLPWAVGVLPAARRAINSQLGSCHGVDRGHQALQHMPKTKLGKARVTHF